MLGERGIALTLASPPGLLSETWSALGLPHVALQAPDRLGLRTASDGRPGVRALMKETAITGRSAWRLAQLARGVDVIHSNSLWTHLDCALAGRIARRPGGAGAPRPRAPGPRPAGATAAVRLASASVAVSRAVAETVGTTGAGFSSFRKRSTPSVSAPARRTASWRARLGGRTDEPIVGVVGRVDPEKGIRTVLQAMTMLAGPAGRAISRWSVRPHSTTAPTRPRCGRRRRTFLVTGPASWAKWTRCRRSCARSTCSSTRRRRSHSGSAFWRPRPAGSP